MKLSRQMTANERSFRLSATDETNRLKISISEDDKLGLSMLISCDSHNQYHIKGSHPDRLSSAIEMTFSKEEMYLHDMFRCLFNGIKNSDNNSFRKLESDISNSRNVLPIRYDEIKDTYTISFAEFTSNEVMIRVNGKNKIDEATILESCRTFKETAEDDFLRQQVIFDGLQKRMSELGEEYKGKAYTYDKNKKS